MTTVQIQEDLAPPLSPGLIHQALKPLIQWMNDGDPTDQHTSEIMPSSDMIDILTHFECTCKIDKPTAGALFIRAMALLNFCQEHELPDSLFTEGIPGRILCTAAANLQVYRDDHDEQHSAHAFAASDIHAALKRASD